MSAYEDFIASNAWDDRFNLPTSPMNNNPWFYMALASKLILLHDGVDPMAYRDFREAFLDFVVGCEKEPGLFDRWPQSQDNPTSQDELIGICYLDQECAQRILLHLYDCDGLYLNKAAGNVVPITQDMFRFPWLLPFIRACAGKSVSLLSQLKYGFYLLTDFWPKSDDASGRLLRFVMNDFMDQFFVSGLFVQLWRWRMKKLGITPSSMLTLEPRENPVYAKYAPEEW